MGFGVSNLYFAHFAFFWIPCSQPSLFKKQESCPRGGKDCLGLAPLASKSPVANDSFFNPPSLAWETSSPGRKTHFPKGSW